MAVSCHAVLPRGLKVTLTDRPTRHMLRFFTGLVIAQLVAAAVITLYPGSSLETVLVLIFSVVLMSLVMSLWFGTVARQLGDQRIAAIKQSFAAEREKMNLTAERAKKKLVKKTQRQMQAHERRTKTKANFKVGTAIALAGGFGLLMMFMQLTTLGLLTMTSVGGAVGGYLARAKREQDLLAATPEYKMIEGVEEVGEVSESGLDKPTPDSVDSVVEVAEAAPETAEEKPLTGSDKG